MPMPIWFIKREHLAGKRITEKMAEQLVRCVGLNAIAAAQGRTPYVPHDGILEAMAMYAAAARREAGPTEATP